MQFHPFSKDPIQRFETNDNHILHGFRNKSQCDGLCENQQVTFLSSASSIESALASSRYNLGLGTIS